MTRPRPRQGDPNAHLLPTVTPDVQADTGLDPDPPCAPRPNRYPSFLEVAIGFEPDLPIMSRMLTVHGVLRGAVLAGQVGCFVGLNAFRLWVVPRE